jgi:acyl-CoA thioesterase-2
MHAYFIRPGRPGIPLDLTVDRTRDGRSFTTRRVTARQNDEAIFIMDASFHVIEDGEDWQPPAPPAVLADPSTLDARPWSARRFARPFELRPVGGPGEEGFPAMHPFWVRADGRLPDDPALHACVMAYMSDMGVVPASLAPGRRRGLGMGASLDHSLWFHRPARADEWLLFFVEPATNYGSRGLARGGMHDQAGRLVLSVAQETLIRSNP